MAEKDQLSYAEEMDDVLMAAAKGALGYVYYETALDRTKGKVRIDIYEKYAHPSREHAAILKEYGVEAKMHKRS